MPSPRPLTDAEARALARFQPADTFVAGVTVRAVAWGSRFLMRWLNHLEITGREHLAAARQPGRGLLTFSNHVSLFDDPWLTACLVDDLSWRATRWIAADALNFFGHPVLARLFNAGKCVPIVRGVGLDQPGMHALEDRLRAGDWVHVFPEGGRSRELDAGLRLPFKTGMAQLVRGTRPMVLPFVHAGMEEVLPVGARLPRVGQRVTLRFGPPTDTQEELADRSVAAITRWAEQELIALATSHARG